MMDPQLTLLSLSQRRQLSTLPFPHLPYPCVQLKPNSITLASSELAPNMFEAGSCQIPLH